MVTTRATSRATSAGPEDSSLSPELHPITPSTTRRRAPRSSANTTKKRRSIVDQTATWRHKPSTTTVLWLAISLPLVIWDTVYILLRPRTMPGGNLHWPLWVPYELYGQVDHIYGWKAYNAKNGFSGAQGFLNAVETLMYLVYLYMLWRRADPSSTEGVMRRSLTGRNGALAVLVGFSAAVMTLSKTVLYWANEYFSGFDNIAHNAPLDLLALWVIPNGFWLVLPTYMIWAFGNNILDGLTLASGHSAKIKHLE
ncbi:hypothetical protein FDECE_6549 [Fusarium decemcellulare]|nr:hypothetical protein FDECE_6549 [Fusarium decemcellulare]